MSLPPELQSLADDPKRSSSAWIIGCAATAFLLVGITGAIILPLFRQTSNSKQNELCVSNLRRLASVSFLYAEDNNGILPGKLGWMDQVVLYEDDPVRYSCPVQRRIDPTTFGYAFAKPLVGALLKKIPEAEKAAMIFDSKAVVRNAVANLDSVPEPARHHNGRKNNVVFADGHAQSIERIGP